MKLFQLFPINFRPKRFTPLESNSTTTSSLPIPDQQLITDSSSQSKYTFWQKIGFALLLILIIVILLVIFTTTSCLTWICMLGTGCLESLFEAMGSVCSALCE